MRIWDIEPYILCRNHLLGEHRELHALWSVIVNNKKGYKNHPETKRWIGKLRALYNRHENLTIEMINRGYSHNSLLEKKFATGEDLQSTFIHSLTEQRKILKSKKCQCKVS